VNAALALLLVSSMLSSGLAMTRERLVALRGDLRWVGLMLVANLVAMPLVALGLSELMALAEAPRTALLLCAMCAGGSSGPALVGLARGDVGTSGPVTLTLVAASSLVATLGASTGVVETSLLLLAQVVPMAIGAAITAWRPLLAERMRRPVSRLASLTLFAVIGGFVFMRGGETRQHDLAFLGAVVVMIAASLAVGWVGTRRVAVRSAGALTTGVRNLSLALLLAASRPPAVQSGVLFYGLFMFVIAAVFALLVRGRGAASSA
jgi:bile acid:Na+ symporter, BASS family